MYACLLSSIVASSLPRDQPSIVPSPLDEEHKSSPMAAMDSSKDRPRIQTSVLTTYLRHHRLSDGDNSKYHLWAQVEHVTYDDEEWRLLRLRDDEVITLVERGV